jgi:hypothetical protein
MLALAAAIPTFALAPLAQAQLTTEFTYQGQLNSDGAPYTGAADLQFRLFTNAGGAVQIGPTLNSSNVDCVDGRFTVLLNFLNVVPAGGHIEVSVRTPHDPTGLAPFTTLSPRQAVTAAPQAYRAEEAGYAEASNLAANALSFGGQLPAFYRDVSNFNTGTLPSGRLSGTYTQSVGFTNPGNLFSGSGVGLTGLQAGNIASGTLATARGGTGSSITSATTGDVLKWNGAAFTAQPEVAYAAGAGLSLTGSTFSIPSNAVGSAMLASDAASLAKVSGGAMQASGQNVSFAGTISIPTTTRSMIIPPAAFASGTASTIEFDATSAAIRSPNTGFAEISAPMMLPVGARITGFTLSAVDSHPNNNMSFELVSVGFPTGGPTSVATASTANVNGLTTITVNGLDIEVLPTRHYNFVATWTQDSLWPNTLSFRGVRIDYTITSPLP